jgi:serine/threonine protein kinase
MQETTSFKILSLLGQGGMAKVYLAEHKSLGHKVAIKVLNKEFFYNDNIRKRFLAEARNLARMNHPNIVRVTDLIEENESAAFVMEHIEGCTLREYMDEKGPLSNDEIKNFFKQMLDALGYVHEKGLIHRDIKPSNFMLDSRGNIKLLDFGIAKSQNASSGEYTQTGIGVQMGTPMYMSPEQVNANKSITPQSDIYSLGVVLWQMVSGTKPYDSSTLSTFQIQAKIVNDPLPLTGTGWDNLIAKATEKNIEKRFSAIIRGKLDDKRLLQDSIQNDKKLKALPENLEETVVIKSEPNRENQEKWYNRTPFFLFILVVIFIVSILLSRSPSEDVEDNKEVNGPVLSDSIAVSQIFANIIFINGGEYQMGCDYPMSDSNSFYCKAEENPVHKVNLSSYYFSTTEVTQYQWESIMGSIPMQNNYCHSCPVTNVNRAQIDSFIVKLNSLGGYNFDLPTEAQWEFAAKGGSAGINKFFLYSGSNVAEDVGWIGDSTGTVMLGKQKLPNDLGIFDMTGNAWEVCKDYFKPYSHKSQKDPVNLESNENNYVIRGGSYLEPLDKGRITSRWSIRISEKFPDVGFRLCINTNAYLQSINKGSSNNVHENNFPNQEKEGNQNNEDEDCPCDFNIEEDKKPLLKFDFLRASIGSELLVCTEKSEPVNVRSFPGGDPIGGVWAGCWNQLVLVSTSDYPWIKVKGRFYGISEGRLIVSEGFVHFDFLRLKK